MENVIRKLKLFSVKFDPILLDFLEKEYKFYKELGATPEAVFSEIVRMVKSGGKRIRPAQLYFSYLACGGKNRVLALKVGASVELLHTFAMIHDDIIDNAVQRRGEPTVQEQCKKLFESHRLTGDEEHFCLSMAILTGDLTFTLADKSLTDLRLPQNIKEEIYRSLNLLRLEIIGGETLDVYSGYLTEMIGESEVLNILKYKTDFYTSGRPLHLGAILAGANEKTKNSLLEIGVLAGSAFQIQDDILGTFGNEKEIGKSPDSDIKEGKRTLLASHAWFRANPSQKKLFKSTLGNPRASDDSLNKIREIFRVTGSLDHCKSVAENLISRAQKKLRDLKLEEEGSDFLSTI